MYFGLKIIRLSASYPSFCSLVKRTVHPAFKKHRGRLLLTDKCGGWWLLDSELVQFVGFFK